jgi:hypothetical protein
MTKLGLSIKIQDIEEPATIEKTQRDNSVLKTTLNLFLIGDPFVA